MKYFKKLNSYMSNFLVICKDAERKSMGRILYECFMLLIKTREFPVHYFSRRLYKRTHTNINDYYRNRILYRLWPYFNDRGFIPLLDNKLLFHIYMTDRGIVIPELLAFNHKKIFHLNNNTRSVENVNEFKALITELVEMSGAVGSVFVKKQIDSFGGFDIYKLSHESLQDADAVEGLYFKLISSSFIFEKKLDQHPMLNKLNPTSINTIRIATYMDSEGIVDFIGAFLRMDIKGLFVDNVSSGGCAVGVNIETGRLEKFGYTSISAAGSDVLTKHPLTHMSFENLEIPFFDELKKMIAHVAGLLPQIRLVGWDVAITPGGPVLIEGNHDLDLTTLDLYCGGLKKSQVFSRAIEEYSLIRKQFSRK